MRCCSVAAAIVGICAAFIGLGGAESGAAATCTLTPTLNDITVSQGLNTYNLLVRGKVALVRLYLTLPSCATTGNAIAVKNTLTDTTKKTKLTVTVKDAASGAVQSTTDVFPTPAIVSPLPQITNLTPLLDVAPSNPMFVIPASLLAPTGDLNRLTVTITASVAYQPMSPAGTENITTFSTQPGTRNAITRTVERRSNALRLLVVPLGSALDSGSTANVQTMTSMLSRVFPVPTGVGALNTTATSGGIRYAINASALDLTTLGVAFPPLCISNATFSLIKGQLAQSGRHGMPRTTRITRRTVSLVQ